MKKVYIHEKSCLAIFNKKADSLYWDKHWKIKNLRTYIKSCKNVDFVIKPLKKYLPNESGIILEGGCGRAQNVYSMKCNCYNAVGIDFATNTVKAVNLAVPDIDVRIGDVRDLPFSDGEIAGYWSVGVIEHFWDGYYLVLDEMSRVIKKNGYLFLTFPYMSPLRKLKGFLGFYNKNLSDSDVKNFYQYCLDLNYVKMDLVKRGFEIKEVHPFDGIKGFKDEVKLLRTFWQKVYDGKLLNGRLGSCIKDILNKFLELFSSHCIFIIAQKL